MTNVLYKCKILIIEETGCGRYENSLYYLGKFSIKVLGKAKKKSLIPIVIREMKIKTTLKYHSMPIRMANFKNS